MIKDNSRSMAEVFYAFLQGECSDCSRPVQEGELITLEANKCRCLPCSGLQGLEFLPSGDIALTNAAQRFSDRKAVVFKVNRSKRRKERLGVLVSASAIEAAQQKCEADATKRDKQRARSAIQRENQQLKYLDAFAGKVRSMYPRAPEGTERKIAERACETGSGRVGRTATAKQLSAGAIGLAVIAYVRHNHTNYDELLSQGYPRDLARDQVRSKIDEVLSTWCPKAAKN